MKLNRTEYKQMDELLGKFLNSYQAGEVSKFSVIGALVHVMTAAAIDNEGELRSWLKEPDVFQQWKQTATNYYFARNTPT